MTKVAAGIELTWQTVPGSRYTLTFKPALDAPVWQPLSTQTATGETLTFVDASADAQRFYQVRVEP